MNLEKKGYRLSIQSWVGKLGNHLIQLSGALNVAEKTRSILTIPSHPLIRRQTFNFLNKANENCLEAVTGRFFFKSDCFQYPVEYDSDRRRIFQQHIYDLLIAKKLQDRLRDLIWPKTHAAVTRNTLVINMRSGSDIFRSDPPPQTDYMQPPLSFYEHIIESNDYEDFLIVTEPARKNPCIDALIARNPKVRLKTHKSVQDDVLTILSATDLVMCHSTFSWCLALMSKKLRKLYQPASFQIKGVGDFATDTYFFDNYINPGEWVCSDDQLRLMVNHSVDDIQVQHSSGAGPGNYTEPSNFW